MASDGNKYISRIAFVHGGGALKTNAPSEYKSRQKQYMAMRNELYNAERAYLSTDYMCAQVQGLNPEDFYEWQTTQIRLADAVKASASATKRADDYKEVLLPELGIDYIPIGAKLVTMGNTWLVVNPQNMSSPSAKTIVARCNATYNSYDYYGNVVAEPIVVEKYSMLGNDNAKPENLVLMDGYFNVTCQLNANTVKLRQNSRIILGDKPYHITGLTNFIQEFTGDRESCHLITFTVRVEEPTEYDDISVNFIANGKTYHFGASIDGQNSLAVGQKAQMTASFVFNGENVVATNVFPLTWQWQSSNTAVATIDENGIVTALSAGNAQISATLAENTAITASLGLQVKETENSAYIAFDGLIPQYLLQYQKATISATVYENGEKTDKIVNWRFAGATDCYYATINGNALTITCISASEDVLTIIAECEDKTASVDITLYGY